MQLKILLRPFSILFGCLVWLRVGMYAIGILPRKRGLIPSVVVGNLRVGGTGKTPMILAIAEALLERGIKPVILSRGYGRKTRGFLEVKADSSHVLVGDEPLMLKQLLPQVSVYVCENRVVGINQILARSQAVPDLVLLDDAFQHLRLKADFYLLLSQWNTPFYTDYLLPEGRLREPRMAAKRAHAFVFTKIPETVSERALKKQTKTVQSYLNNAPVFTAYPEIQQLIAFDASKKIQLKDLSSQRVFLISAIANPADFEDMMSKYLQITGHEKFRDHALISNEQITKINAKAERKKAIVVCTHKDYARLLAQFTTDSALFKHWYFVDYRFRLPQQADLIDLILQRVAKFAHS